MKICIITCDMCQNAIKDYRPLEINIMPSNGLRSGSTYHFCVNCEREAENSFKKIWDKRIK